MQNTPLSIRQCLRASSLAHINALRASCPSKQCQSLSTLTATRPADRHLHNSPTTRRSIPIKSPARAYSSPSAPQTHYDFFPTTLPRGAPPKGPFSVDLRALRAEFLKQQAAAHPDRHPAGEAKRRAEALSARINEAYKVLADPLMRAQYVLGLQGIDVAEDETAKVEDQALLMEVLEAREVIEGAESEDEVRALQDQNEQRLGETVESVEHALENGDWDVAKAEAVRLRYWVNIKEACTNWEMGKPVTLQH